MNAAADKSISQLDVLEQIAEIKPFAERLKEMDAFPMKSNSLIHTLQINTGKICNLSCKHCHVEAGPHRTESMSQDIMGKCLQVMTDYGIKNLDITGGAPELNPNHQWLIQQATQINCHVMTRCNLTVLDLEPYVQMPEFYAEHKVEIVASLPYYTPKNTDRMRGDGVFQTSVKILKKLNELGYGQEGTGLKLNLVYNPGGAFLPADQQGIEADFRRNLWN